MSGLLMAAHIVKQVAVSGGFDCLHIDELGISCSRPPAFVDLCFIITSQH
jgi:hypothetical protein